VITKCRLKGTACFVSIRVDCHMQLSNCENFQRGIVLKYTIGFVTIPQMCQHPHIKGKNKSKLSLYLRTVDCRVIRRQYKILILFYFTMETGFVLKGRKNIEFCSSISAQRNIWQIATALCNIILILITYNIHKRLWMNNWSTKKNWRDKNHSLEHEKL
jgi:hypothetical protein